MLEAAELGQTVSREEFESQEPELRMELLRLQNELKLKAEFPVIIALAGDDRPGANEVLNLLHAWMDPRFLQAHAFRYPTEEERQRPVFWRYWQAMPAKGRISIVMGGPLMLAIESRLRKRIDDSGLDRMLDHIAILEQMLADDGALILKFWLHLPKKQLARRIRQADKDPIRASYLPESQRWLAGHYKPVRELSEEILQRTHSAATPWHLVESTDRRFRDLTVAQAICRELSKRIDAAEENTSAQAAAPAARISEDPTTVLDEVDLSASVSKEEYEKKLPRWQGRLSRLAAKAMRKKVSTIVVFEGWDAAGKGGAIRRLTGALDAAAYRVVPIAAPTEEERARHYLWRFWRHLPRAGDMTIFDRSWYGRVLVERVEGLAGEREWRRAYAEIDDFEAQLHEHGIVLVKFWLHIDAEEQARRFQAREQTPYKKYKITEEDYRNRDRRNDYEQAVKEMLQWTDTRHAPWYIIAANDKHWARLDILKTVCRRLKESL